MARKRSRPNNNGVIVGSGGCGNAIIVTGGVCQDLQKPIQAGTGYTLQEAKGINDKGQIIAYAQLSTDPGHPVHAVLLTPTEPRMPAALVETHFGAPGEIDRRREGIPTKGVRVLVSR